MNWNVELQYVRPEIITAIQLVEGRLVERGYGIFRPLKREFSQCGASFVAVPCSGEVAGEIYTDPARAVIVRPMRVRSDGRFTIKVRVWALERGGIEKTWDAVADLCAEHPISVSKVDLNTARMRRNRAGSNPMRWCDFYGGPPLDLPEGGRRELF